MDPTSRWEDLSPIDRYGRYNFQREEHLEELKSLVLASLPESDPEASPAEGSLTEDRPREDRPSVVLLEGFPGAARRYAVESVVFDLRRTGHEARGLYIDLASFEPDVPGAIERFTKEQYVQLRLEDQELLGSLLGFGRHALATIGEWSSALLISVLLQLQDPARAFQQIQLPEDRVATPSELPRKVLRDFFRFLARRGPVLLFVDRAEELVDPLRRWLLGVAQAEPGLTLALSCRPGTLEVNTRVPAAQLRFEPLKVPEILYLLRQRFPKNRFPEALAKELYRSSRGLPMAVMGRVFDLVKQDLLREDRDGIWHLPSEDLSELAPAFSEESWEVWETRLSTLGDFEDLKEFLFRACLCGDLVPAELVLGSMQVSPERIEELVDLVDDHLLPAEGRGLFEEPRSDHSGFPGIWIYRFQSRLLPDSLAAQLQVWEQEARAREMLESFQSRIEVRTRAVAQLFLNLAAYLNQEEQAPYRHKLAWWVGHLEVDALQESISEALESGRMDPEALWQEVRGAGHQPIFRRLALLEVYGAQKKGIPLEQKGDFHFLRATLLKEVGRLGDAFADIEQTLGLWSSKYGRVSAAYATGLSLQGSLLRGLGKPDRAKSVFLEALSFRDKGIELAQEGWLAIQGMLAGALQDLGELESARNLNQQVLEEESRLLGAGHPSTLSTRHNLAGNLRKLGDLGSARDHFQQVLEALQRLVGPDHPRVLITRNNLAGVLEEMGELESARTHYQQVLDDLQRVLGPDHPETLTTANNLAGSLHKLGELESARRLYQQVLEDGRRILGPDHPYIFAVSNNLAGVLRDLGELEPARSLYQQVVEDRLRVHGPDHPDTKAAQAQLSDLE
ncbi:MAG: tetratricopeptide repeat protein [Deltaproteobacteria bacterium]|nr:tetratricopeptide repeat protein [Deltaproteobacteria bacterium]